MANEAFKVLAGPAPVSVVEAAVKALPRPFVTYDPHNYDWYPKLDDGTEMDQGLIEAVLEYEKCSGGYEVLGVIVKFDGRETDLLKEDRNTLAYRIGRQIASDAQADGNWQREVSQFEAA